MMVVVVKVTVNVQFLIATYQCNARGSGQLLEAVSGIGSHRFESIQRKTLGTSAAYNHCPKITITCVKPNINQPCTGFLLT
jgi:hypothetical protein